MRQRGSVEQLGKPSRGWKWRWWCKKAKHRSERRKARLDPCCAPGYNRYAG